MRWTDAFLYSKIVERDASYNGRFLVAATSTMIYWLPSCPARKPNRETCASSCASARRSTRAFVRAFGSIAHPGPTDVAALDEADRKKRKFSTSKARYLIGAARAVPSSGLPVESLNAGSAKVAEDALRSMPGIGVWTANYVMMRGVGFVDCAPAGDSALSTALKRLYDLPDRPDAAESGKLMEQYSPYRSFATAHLWASLSSE